MSSRPSLSTTSLTDERRDRLHESRQRKPWVRVRGGLLARLSDLLQHVIHPLDHLERPVRVSADASLVVAERRDPVLAQRVGQHRQAVVLPGKQRRLAVATGMGPFAPEGMRSVPCSTPVLVVSVGSNGVMVNRRRTSSGDVALEVDAELAILVHHESALAPWRLVERRGRRKPTRRARATTATTR